MAPMWHLHVVDFNENFGSRVTKTTIFETTMVSCSFSKLREQNGDFLKVLGVEKDASQRQIQKAFHKLSLQYHPDKNKSKGAQDKFAEINNAYDILSDEEKRKNYDLHGDARGNPGFDGGDQGGHSGFTFRPDERQTTGGGSKSYSFSFGRENLFGDVFDNFFGGSQNSFGDVFNNFFGGSQKSFGFDSGDGFGNFFGGGKSHSESMKSLISINSQLYKKEIVNKGMTWLLLSFTPKMKGTQTQYYESIIEEVASSLKGALEVGSVNCEAESSLCKELGIKAGRVYVYSYKGESGSLLEYSGDSSVKALKSFVHDHLPKLSKRVTLAQFEITAGALPKVMLLSTKKDTPVIWHALSGLYRKHFHFYDAQVQDVSDPTVKELGVDALPAVVGWLSNGEKRILKTGIAVKDMNSTIRDLSSLLEGFERKNKKIASDSDIPLLTPTNFDAVCGEKTPVCIIGVFRSSKGREKLYNILSSVSQKSLLRRQNLASGPRDSVAYALLDASNQSSVLQAFEKSGFKSSERLLIAYKARKSKFCAFKGDLSREEVERFVGSVVNGDVQFSKMRHKPTLK